MTGLLMPSMAVPPTSFGSSEALSALNSSLMASAAILVLKFFMKMPLSWRVMYLMLPSMPLSRTLPVKPSVTTTSTSPLKTCEASTLPMKRMRPAASAALSSGKVSC